MRQVSERIDEFMKSLRTLAREGYEDRAALADLRSGLGQPPGQAMRMHAHVVPFLNERAEPSDRWFFVVGALFAWHPQRARERLSLGGSFHQLRREGASESIEARFVALLGSDERDLHLHLRQAVGLLRANDRASGPVAVDWRTLLDDLALPWRGWNHPQREVQMDWARHYYKDPKSTAPQNAASSAKTEPQS